MRFGKCQKCNEYKHLPNNGKCSNCTKTKVEIQPFIGSTKKEFISIGKIAHKIDEEISNSNIITVSSDNPDYSVAIFDDSVLVGKNSDNKKEFDLSAYQSNLSALCDDIKEYIKN